jgi:hypothetical protein
MSTFTATRRIREGRGHFYYDDPAGDDWTNFANSSTRRAFEDTAHKWFAGRVRSMSGRTAAHLGSPDIKWLNGV